jgi:hypothetical protein
MTVRQSRRSSGRLNRCTGDLNAKELLDKEYLLISKQGIEALQVRFADWIK